MIKLHNSQSYGIRSKHETETETFTGVISGLQHTTTSGETLKVNFCDYNKKIYGGWTDQYTTNTMLCKSETMLKHLQKGDEFIYKNNKSTFVSLDNNDNYTIQYNNTIATIPLHKLVENPTNWDFEYKHVYSTKEQGHTFGDLEVGDRIFYAKIVDTYNMQNICPIDFETATIIYINKKSYDATANLLRG
jgi:hypothetical protein